MPEETVVQDTQVPETLEPAGISTEALDGFKNLVQNKTPIIGQETSDPAKEKSDEKTDATLEQQDETSQEKETPKKLSAEELRQKKIDERIGKITAQKGKAEREAEDLRI